jgi:hypothetical protein
MSRLSRPVPSGAFPKAYFASSHHANFFDPALKHYRRAFIQIPELSKRDVTLEACIQGIAQARVREHVVLRGSLSLARWFGSDARSPHDVDLIVRDDTIGPSSTEAFTILDELRVAACEGLRKREIRVLGDEISTDNIWTYERAEGRRVSIPYDAENGALDAVQIDVVFRSPLLQAPTFERVVPDNSHDGIWMAIKAESLAWKLLWLASDSHPQAKDLYDAVLLAEAVSLPRTLLEQTINDDTIRWPEVLDRIVMDQDTWRELLAENLKFAHETIEGLRNRLGRALRITA